MVGPDGDHPDPVTVCLGLAHHAPLSAPSPCEPTGQPGPRACPRRPAHRAGRPPARQTEGASQVTSPSSTRSRIARCPPSTSPRARSTTPAGYRAHSHWGRPRIVDGHHASGRRVPCHQAQESERQTGQIGRNHEHRRAAPPGPRRLQPAATAASGPCPAGTSWVCTNVVYPGPTSITGAATSASNAAVRSAQGPPPTASVALSRPRRRLCTPGEKQPGRAERGGHGRRP